MRGATSYLEAASRAVKFQSTLPMRGATLSVLPEVLIIDISIHAPHAGSDAKFFGCHKILVISIHAPHAGSDDQKVSTQIHTYDFNPRSPCGERRARSIPATPQLTFQSTLPMRGATIFVMLKGANMTISIHAPHAGSDSDWYFRMLEELHFNPRSPCGERRL